MPKLRRMRRPATIGMLGKLAELLTLAALLTLVPRSLGAGDYGAFALALAVATVAGTSLSLGGPTLLSRFVAVAPPAEQASAALALALGAARWRLALAALACAAAVAATLAAPEAVPPLPAALVTAALVLDVLATLGLQTALALGAVTAWSLRFPLQNAVLVPAAIALHSVWGREGAIAAIPISAAAGLALGVAVALPRLRHARPSNHVLAGVSRFAVLQGASGALAQLTARGGVLAVALVVGGPETGYAALAAGIALALVYVAAQAFAAELPDHAALERRAAERTVERMVWAGTLAFLPIALAGPLLVPRVLPHVAGAAYDDAATATAVALAAVPFAPAAAALNQLAALRLDPGVRLAWVAAGAVVFGAAAAALVPRYEAAGASGALVAASAVVAIGYPVTAGSRSGARGTVLALVTSAAAVALAVR